ncbi:MAG: FMN-binding protein, partial [Clostridiaceae bacterium]|nr:FMN-binding protein [Clostridiaceae bacterium]
MLSEKLIEVITSPPDAALTLVTEGEGGPHLANS